ncbi:hypothetical protein DERP_007805 [Dermatophagoides pteronyssinus]|uniref:Uncharacterized protein n=1 Tax=Dermatophagoides pteronyssinus TaxID=6956 RepID=A0ABQ8ISP3_DERPT|nr:hypothetical protein DERP_007805 [Dermatophagoides pteronyssinus]
MLNHLSIDTVCFYSNGQSQAAVDVTCPHQLFQQKIKEETKEGRLSLFYRKANEKTKSSKLAFFSV